MAASRSRIASPPDLDQTLGLDEAHIFTLEQGTLLLPPSPAIAFRTLPHTRTLLTVCALFSIGNAGALRRQTNRDEDDPQRTPRALVLPAALCGSLVRHLIVSGARSFAGFWPICESAIFFFACGGQQGEVTVHAARLPCYCHPAADRVVYASFRRYGLCFSVEGCSTSSAAASTYSGLCVCACELCHGGHGTVLDSARTAHHRRPCGSVCVWPSTTSFSAPISTRWARFAVGLDVLVAARVHVFF